MDIMAWLGTLPGAAAQGLVWGLMAVGVYMTYKILDVADLTVDGSIATGAAVCAVLVTKGVNIWVAMLCALLAGILAGTVTGLIHVFLGIPAILSGILTQLMLWSANLLILGGKANLGLPRLKFGDKLLISSDVAVSNGKIFVTLGILAAFCAVVILALYLFLGTKFGAAVRATGNNLNMSRAQGINTNLTKVVGLAISNGVVALAGSLLVQQQGGASVDMGRGAIVYGLAAIVIGEALCARFNTPYVVKQICVLCGGIIYWFVYQTVIFIGLPTEYFKMLSAIVVALFLGLPYIKKTYFSRAKKKEGHKNA